MFKKTLMVAGLVLSAVFANAAYASPSIEPLVQETIVRTGNHLLMCAEYVDLCFVDAPGKPVAYNATQLEAVNKKVNAEIEYTPEAEDHWTVNPKKGDCEDYALTKMVDLIALGYPRNELHLTMVVLKETGEKHMVLNVETTSGTYVLDNRSSKVKRWDEITYYKWVATEQFTINNMILYRINNFWNTN